MVKQELHIQTGCLCATHGKQLLTGAPVWIRWFGPITMMGTKGALSSTCSTMGKGGFEKTVYRSHLPNDVPQPSEKHRGLSLPPLPHKTLEP